MTWTYDETLPTDRDKVRVLIDDIDTNNQLLQDEAIAMFLSDAGNNIYRAAALSASTIATKFASDKSVTIGPMSVTGGEGATAYQERVRMLFVLADQYGAGAIASPFVGGISKAERQLWGTDTDLIQVDFSKGMHDNPETLFDTDWYGIADE